MSPKETQVNSNPEEAAEAMNANQMASAAAEKMSGQAILEHDLSPLTARATTGESPPPVRRSAMTPFPSWPRLAPRR